MGLNLNTHLSFGLGGRLSMCELVSCFKGEYHS